MKKIFALAENGVVDLAFSRSPSVTAHDDANWEISHAEPCERVQVSLLLNARVHMFNLATEESDLYQNLRKRGLVRNWRNPSDTDSDFVAGGLDILPKRNLLVRQDGQVNTSMAALGVPTEGAHYFHLAAQRPFCSDPIVVDAAAVLAEIQRHRTECAAKHETGDAFHA